MEKEKLREVTVTYILGREALQSHFKAHNRYEILLNVENHYLSVDS